MLSYFRHARHPNVIQFIDFVEHGESRYILCEFVPCGSVRDWIKHTSKSFPWKLRLSFAIDIARALTFLHSRHIIHRDVKASNCLVTENMRVKVGDFGLARLAATSDDEMRRISYCGTEGYLAPEIMLGMPFGPPVDIFSFGIVLCELICRMIVDEDEFLTRSIPGLGVDPDSIRRHAEQRCPDTFMDAAIVCTDADPKLRPSWKEIQRVLRMAEASLPDLEHVGTMKEEADNDDETGNTMPPSIMTMFELKSPRDTVQFKEKYGYQHLTRTTRSELEWIIEPSQASSIVEEPEVLSEADQTQASIHQEGERQDKDKSQPMKESLDRIHRFSIVKIKIAKPICRVCEKRLAGLLSPKKCMECDGKYPFLDRIMKVMYRLRIGLPSKVQPARIVAV